MKRILSLFLVISILSISISFSIIADESRDFKAEEESYQETAKFDVIRKVLSPIIEEYGIDDFYIVNFDSDVGEFDIYMKDFEELENDKKQELLDSLESAMYDETKDDDSLHFRFALTDEGTYYYSFTNGLLFKDIINENTSGFPSLFIGSVNIFDDDFETLYEDSFVTSYKEKKESDKKGDLSDKEFLALNAIEALSEQLIMPDSLKVDEIKYVESSRNRLLRIKFSAKNETGGEIDTRLYFEYELDKDEFSEMYQLKIESAKIHGQMNAAENALAYLRDGTPMEEDETSIYDNGGLLLEASDYVSSSYDIYKDKAEELDVDAIMEQFDD